MAAKSTVQSRLVTRVAELDAQIEDLQAKRIALEQIPLDDFSNGAVVVFEKKFNRTSVTYTYAAVKGGGAWYLSGSATGRSWEDLTDYLYARISEGGFITCYLVTEMTQV